MSFAELLGSDCTMGRSWAAKAACRGNTMMFYRHRCQAKCYSSHGEACMRSYTARRALMVCESCSVKLECREWALSTSEQYGISGGLTEAQRVSAITVRRRVTPKLVMLADMRHRKALKALREQRRLLQRSQDNPAGE